MKHRTVLGLVVALASAVSLFTTFVMVLLVTSLLLALWRHLWLEALSLLVIVAVMGWVWVGIIGEWIGALEAAHEGWSDE